MAMDHPCLTLEHDVLSTVSKLREYNTAINDYSPLMIIIRSFKHRPLCLLTARQIGISNILAGVIYNIEPFTITCANNLYILLVNLNISDINALSPLNREMFNNLLQLPLIYWSDRQIYTVTEIVMNMFKIFYSASNTAHIQYVKKIMNINTLTTRLIQHHIHLYEHNSRHIADRIHLTILVEYYRQQRLDVVLNRYLVMCRLEPLKSQIGYLEIYVESHVPAAHIMLVRPDLVARFITKPMTMCVIPTQMIDSYKLHMVADGLVYRGKLTAYYIHNLCSAVYAIISCKYTLISCQIMFQIIDIIENWSSAFNSSLERQILYNTTVIRKLCGRNLSSPYKMLLRRETVYDGNEHTVKSILDRLLQ